MLLAAREVAVEAGATKRQPKISIVAYTGGVMRVPGWGDVVIDLDGLDATGQVPLLADHNATVSGAVGHGEARVVDGRLIVTGVISGAGEVAKQIVEMTTGGFTFQASVGVEPVEHERIAAGSKVEVNGRTLSSQRGFTLVKVGRLREISITPLAADAGTSVAIAASTRKEPYMTATQDSRVDEQTIQAQERQRIKDIDRMCTGDWGRRSERVEQMRAQAIDGEISIEELREGLLHQLRASRPMIGVGVGGGSQRPTEGLVIRAAAARNMGVPPRILGEHYGFDTVHEAASSCYDGMGLHAIMRQVVLAAGRSVPHNATDLVRSAFEVSRAVQASGTSTMSLPGILSDAAHKAALAAYHAVPTVWSMLAATTSLTNFKPHKRYRMTGIGRFEEVGNDGELKHITFKETEYENQAHTEGAILGITRQDLIDDDMGMFQQSAQALGRMGAIAVERAVFALLLSNPDGFFSIANGNLRTGADSAFGLTGATEAEKLFWQFTDKNGDPVMVSPATLLVPPSLATMARQLLSSTELVAGSNESQPEGMQPNANPFHRRFKLAVSPWLSSQSLSGSSDAGWYLFADPEQGVAAIEVGFVNGRQMPIIESNEMDFDKLGMQWRGYFDFGVAMREPTGAVRSAGE